MNFRQKCTPHFSLYIVLCSSLFTFNSWSAIDTGDIDDVPDPVVHIPDPMLAQALRKEMKLHPNLKITKARIARLGTLNVSNQGIKELTGLEHALRLTRLIIAFNPVSDLTPLAELRGLRHLDARECNICDLRPLANLRYLAELRLSGNQIEDIAPVENLPRLRRFEIDDNPLTDPSVLEPVDIPDPNLRAAVRDALNLSAGVPITCTAMRLLVELYAVEKQIKDLTGLEHALELKLLHLGRNEIEELQPLASLVNLERLYLFVNPISNLSQLVHLTGLRTLDLGGCQMSDISPIAGLTQLVSLRLHWNQIEDIRPLINLTQLTELYLHNNRIADVRSLANLMKLESLQVHNNVITDLTPLDGLSLTHFTYDQNCEMASRPILPRLQDRDFPSVFIAWNWRILNRPKLSHLDQISLHDLYLGPWFGLNLKYTGQAVKIEGYLENARLERDEFLALNPNMVFLFEIRMRSAPPQDFPEDSPYWVRDAQGSIVGGWGDHGLIDFTHPGLQDLIVQQAVAVAKCGLYDGIFFDYWREDHAVLKGYRTLEAELVARNIILQRIRAETRSDFLIMVNNNRHKLPRTAPYINIMFMETGTPGGFGGEQPQGEQLESEINQIENTVRWAEQNLREPRLIAVEGWAIPTEPLDSPTNLRWMRAFTTLTLTHTDGYTLIIKGRGPGELEYGHYHYWYDFWDADLGRPVGLKSQLYDEDIPGLYFREFTNGWAVYNHSGETQVFTLPEKAQGVASGLVNTEHALPNLDGEMYLRVKPTNPADVNNDGVVNILDLTIIARRFGTDSLEGDVNGDGVVNVFDLVFVANAF